MYELEITEKIDTFQTTSIQKSTAITEKIL